MRPIFSFQWIKPLQNKGKEELPRQNSSFLKAWSIVCPILLYYIACSLCIMLFAYFMRWSASLDGVWYELAKIVREYSLMAAAVVNGLSMLVGIVVLFPLFKTEKLQWSMPKGHKKDIPLLFIAGASTALFFNVLFSLLQFTGSSENYAEVAGRQFSLPLWAGVVLYGIISPLAEEMVFRGLVYNRLDQYFGRGIAVIGSALFFGLYHGNIVQALYGFILGMVIAVLYERYDSFIVPVLMHGAANISVYVISSNDLWQAGVMNWGACAISGILGILIFIFLMFYPKNE